MAALQHSPVALLSKLSPSSSRPAVISSVSLRPSSSFPASRLRPLLPSLPRRRRGGATMMDTPARTYASAFAEVAQSSGSLDQTIDDMKKVQFFFIYSPNVFSFFTNPTVSVEIKSQMIDDFATGSGLLDHTRNFLNVLLDMKRFDILPDVFNEFDIAYNRITGTEIAVVESVVPIKNPQLAEIASSIQKLTGAKNVRVQSNINPNLIAGFTVRFGPSGSKLIDLSVKKQLEEIARELEVKVDLVNV